MGGNLNHGFFSLQMVSEQTIQAISKYTGVSPVMDTDCLLVGEPDPLVLLG